MYLRQLEAIPWYVFIIYWLVSAARLKQTKVEEDSGGRLLHILILIAAFDLMFRGNFSFGVLNERMIPLSLPFLYTGIALTWLGVAFAIWARSAIGQNWSGRVTVKVDHQLIQSGPYAFVRHPIYSGLLLANMGAALFIGQWRCLAALLIFLAEISRKASKEERFMLAEFGDRYEKYRHRTGFLIPKFGGNDEATEGTISPS
jgi:protein-S-isoprenylcysteine O-methyltransferase Ste14